MKVVVAVDSFKGSMTSMEAGMAVKEGILAAKKDAEVVVKPLADGGEGTTDALIEGLKGERVDVTVTGPYHVPGSGILWISQESNTAVMEMATAAGITLSDKKGSYDRYHLWSGRTDPSCNRQRYPRLHYRYWRKRH